jgi:hypothetical protein
VTGAAIFKSTLSVQGALSLSDLGVTGSASMSNSLAVAGDFSVGTAKFSVGTDGRTAG